MICPYRVGTRVRIVKVLPPAPPTSPPIKQPHTPTVDQPPTKIGPETVTQNGEASDCEIINVVSNGISEVPPSDAIPKPVTPSVKPVFKIPKTPRTPSTPLTPEISLNADDYRYVVKNEANPEIIRELKAAELSRPKGLFTSAKLKLLLRSVLVRKSDKHPFTVKVSSLAIKLLYWLTYTYSNIRLSLSLKYCVGYFWPTHLHVAIPPSVYCIHEDVFMSHMYS